MRTPEQEEESDVAQILPVGLLPSMFPRKIYKQAVHVQQVLRGFVFYFGRHTQPVTAKSMCMEFMLAWKSFELIEKYYRYFLKPCRLISIGNIFRSVKEVFGGRGGGGRVHGQAARGVHHQGDGRRARPEYRLPNTAIRLHVPQVGRRHNRSQAGWSVFFPFGRFGIKPMG